MYLMTYSKTCVKGPSSKRPNIGFQDQLSLNAGQKHCRILSLEHSAKYWPSLSYHLSLKSLFCLFLVAILHLFYCILQTIWSNLIRDHSDCFCDQISLECIWTYSKTCVNWPLKIDKTKMLMTNGSLMKVKGIAECPKGSILHFFDNWSWKPIFCFSKSGPLTQVLLYAANIICRQHWLDKNNFSMIRVKEKIFRKNSDFRWMKYRKKLWPAQIFLLFWSLGQGPVEFGKISFVPSKLGKLDSV